MHKERETETDRDRQTDRQTHTHTHTHTHIDRQADRQTDRQTDRQAGRHTDRQTETHRQTNRDTHKHTTHLFLCLSLATTLVCALLQVAASPVRVLSYAPGPLDTDMQADIRHNLANDELRPQFAAMKDKVCVCVCVSVRLSVRLSVSMLMCLPVLSTFVCLALCTLTPSQHACVQGTLVTTAASAKKLWELLHADDYESGAHIDFFDSE